MPAILWWTSITYACSAAMGVLLCTNGLTDVVTDNRIVTFRRTSREQCRLLVDLALRAGTENNLTVLLAKYEIPRTQSAFRRHSGTRPREVVAGTAAARSGKARREI